MAASADIRQLGRLKRALEAPYAYGLRLLSLSRPKWSDRKKDRVIHKLVYDYPEHGFRIGIRELNELGIDAEPVPVDLRSLVISALVETFEEKESVIEPVTPKDEKVIEETDVSRGDESNE
jgi:hypothetical protein